jgi:hypothetical protein
MASEITGSNTTSSIALEVDLNDILSILGISLPTVPTSGSLPELPNKIKMKPVSGVVVNSTTNEPLPGVKIRNILLKTATTNKKGEFTITNPDIGGTGLEPSKFKLNLTKKGYSPTTIIPFTSVGDLKPNLGIITLNAKESNLKKEITALLKFPPQVVEEYTTKDVTVDFQTQKKLNSSINDLKAIVIPLVLSLIAVYGISEVQKIIEKSKINPVEAFDEIKDIITCPTKDEIDKLIATKNKLVKKLNQTLSVINTTTQILAQTQDIIDVAVIALPIAQTVLESTPTSIAGVPILYGIISNLQKVIDFLNQNIGKLSYINSTTLSILNLLRGVLIQVLDFLNLLDLLTQYCYPDAQQEQVSTELTALTIQQTTQTSPIVTVAYGFTMGVETEVTENPLKRRRAIAKNKQNIVMLKGEWSFSSIDQILIDELVFYIQQNNLKAD